MQVLPQVDAVVAAGPDRADQVLRLAADVDAGEARHVALDGGLDHHVGAPQVGDRPGQRVVLDLDRQRRQIEPRQAVQGEAVERAALASGSGVGVGVGSGVGVGLGEASGWDWGSAWRGRGLRSRLRRPAEREPAAPPIAIRRTAAAPIVTVRDRSRSIGLHPSRTGGGAADRC